ncbi:MAG: Flp family type IVb pilin [Rhodomicrobium sp.]|jgi:pilus assembly protein Flp/PilA
MRLKLQQFLHDESGAAAIEVGLIAAGICVAIITLAGQMNDDVKIYFERLREWLRSFNLHAMT